MSFSGSYALQLLEDTDCLSVPVNLDAIVEAKNIILKYEDVEGYTGMLLVVGDKALISVKKSIKEEARKRFTIAHELGHFSIPRHITKENNIYRCSDSDINTFGKKTNKEVEANYFAAELLMPEEHFKQRIMLKDLSKKLIFDLLDEFQTSLTATSIRFVSLRTEYALICSERSRVKWFHHGEEFPYFINAQPGSPLHRDSHAYDFFMGGQLPEGFLDVSSDAWIDDYRFKDSAKVMEMAIGLPAYNQVLSFLYVDKIEDDEYEDNDYYKELDGYPKFR
jgi:Zn-dependent peptidase ImmA (M78 family)